MKRRRRKWKKAGGTRERAARRRGGDLHGGSLNLFGGGDLLPKARTNTINVVEKTDIGELPDTTTQNPVDQHRKPKLSWHMEFQKLAQRLLIKMYSKIV